jgi:hypothetical protein
MSDVPPPPMPEERIADAGYVQTGDETEVGFESRFVTVRTRTQIFEDETLRDALPGHDVERTIRAVFGTRLGFDPPFSRAPVSPESVVGLAANRARSEFVEDLRRSGLRDLSVVGTRRFRWGRVEGRLFDVRADYPLSAGNVLVDGEEQRGRHTGGAIDLRAQVLAAIRPWRDTFVMAGVAFPRESVAAAVERSRLSGEIAVDHGVDPTEARNEGVELIRAVGR